MHKTFCLAVAITLFSGLFFSSPASAQDIPIGDGWKFKTGDSAAWASPIFNDSEWKPIRVSANWETQGYDGYDGFGWYRLHVVIPSSIRDKSFLKEKLRIELGKIDDGDEVYLNGLLIGRNGGRGGMIQNGDWDLPRSYTLSLTDARIRWDKENIIAVRVYDKSGGGGMFEGPYGISVMDVTDFITINTTGDAFHFSTNANGLPVVQKKIVLQSTSDKYDFTGKLTIRATDPATGAAVFKQTIGADFAHDRPFEYTVKTSLPENKSYRISYDFVEGRSGKIVSVIEGTSYILTPAPKPAPRINGPKVYGVRPGMPFLYRIPATGTAPLTYRATGLPAGLSLDAATGIITGVLPAKGSFHLRFTVKNALGETSRPFTIVCGDKISLTPAMGWNSWNCWGLSVSDQKVRSSAKAMAEKLAAHGWTYVNIDDGWEAAKRDSSGSIVANSKFPDMKALSDYIHGLGLKIGIYSSPGPRTCGGYLGSYQHEFQDAVTYGRWGIDYLKYDWCSYGDIAPQAPSLDDYKKPYILMRQGLDKAGRDILYSLCQYGMGDVWKWGGEIGANSWRTTGDINDSWGSLSGIGFTQDKPAPYTVPGNFNDPDMLVVGKVGWGPSLHETKLTPEEQYLHISLWCLLSSPLLIGCDMSQFDDFTLGLLTNDDVLEIDQDMLAKPAQKLSDKDGVQIWVKELEGGNKAIGVFNLNDAPVKLSNISAAAIPAGWKLRDLWRNKDLGTQSVVFHSAQSVPSHGVLFWKASPVTGGR